VDFKPNLDMGFVFGTEEVNKIISTNLAQNTDHHTSIMFIDNRDFAGNRHSRKCLDNSGNSSAALGFLEMPNLINSL
jgi:hypothetical protein